MIAKGSKSWNFDAILGDSKGEMMLSLSDIILYPLYRDDYQFTGTEILAEQRSLQKIGLTKRLVVEQVADGYVLIGPLLPYLALVENGADAIPCIVRNGDLPQVQQVLSVRLNAEYSRLSPLVYSRLITRLERLYPVMKAVSGMNLGIKRAWIADILGISSSAVLRYSYISNVPEALQQRCNNPDFPYLCYKEALHFTDSQFRELLQELIHYELHSRYIQISAGELSKIIHDIAAGTDEETFSSMNGHSSIDLQENCDVAASSETPVNKPSLSPCGVSMSALYEPLTETYYQNLLSSYEERFDDEADAGTASEMMRIAHKDGYFVPDDALREASYLLYSLSRMRLAGGQRLLEYACLRSIQDSLTHLCDQIG